MRSDLDLMAIGICVPLGVEDVIGAGGAFSGISVTNERSQVICHATPSWDRFYFCYLSIFTIAYLLTCSIFAIYDPTVFLSISIILRIYLSFFPFLVYTFLLYKP